MAQKRIMNHACLKNFDHYVVLNAQNQMIGWIKRYFNGNGSNPDTYTQIEICEFDQGKTYSSNEPRSFIGFNDDACLQGQTIFGIKYSDHSMLDNQLWGAGINLFNLTP